jgi:Protein of unknown function (DUF2550)
VGDQVAVDVGAVLAAIVLMAVGVLAGLWVRRWLLERAGGTVECSMRLSTARRVWRLGIGRYNGDELLWFAIFGLRLRPRRVIHRRGLVVAGRRGPEGDEIAELFPDAEILQVRDGEELVELAMSHSALTGFLAWMEAAPPGYAQPYP